MKIISILNKISSTNQSVLVKKLWNKFYYLFYDFTNYLIDFSRGTYYCDNANQTIGVSILKNNSFIDNHKREIIDFADYIAAHKFSFLGTGFVNLNKANQILNNNINSNKNNSYKLFSLIDRKYKLIEWHKDFKSNFTWDNSIWYKKIKYGINNSDIKIPWELGRMQYSMVLAYAFSISKNEIYANEFRNQCLDFFCQNPPKFGVQWKSPMDVGIRTVNLLIAYQIFKNSGFKFDSEFEFEFANYNYYSGKFIYQNPEWSGGQRGNHFLSNICSLIIISQFFKNIETEKWLKFAINSLENEIFYQFGEDGGNFEASLNYHYFAFEMILTALLVLKQNDIQLYNNFINKKNIIHRINQILNFSFNNLSLDNMDNYFTNQIGDNDSGFFTSLFFELHDNHYSFDTSKKNNIIYLIDELFDVDKRQIELIKNSFNAYKDFGLSIYRNDLFDFSIRCGTVGQYGKGGHSHNDQLSITLSVLGKQIIVDSGTYIYTSEVEMRNKFRSTSAHNTLVIENVEQNEIGNDLSDLFWLKDKSKAEILNSTLNEFKGIHFGYKQPHTREIKIVNNIIYGKDICEIDIIKKIKFHIHNDCEIEQMKSNSISIKNGNIHIILTSKDGKIKIEESLYSPEYGIIQKNKVIIIESVNFEIDWNLEFNKFELK